MEQTIVITPAKGISINSALTGSYLHPELNVSVTLTMDKNLVEGPLKPNEKPFRFKFGKYNPKYVNRVNITESDPILKKKAENEKIFWSKHPHVKMEGGDNKYLKNELFVMSIEEDIEKRAYESSMQKLQVMNIVNNLDDKTRYDLCFFFGGDPTKKQKWQVWNDLVSLEDGKLMNSGNIKKFLEIMSDDKKEELVTRTIIKKALHYGVIVTEQNKYWTKQRELLGMSEDDIFLHYRSHPDGFKFIKQEVAGLDVGFDNIETKSNKK